MKTHAATTSVHSKLLNSDLEQSRFTRKAIFPILKPDLVSLNWTKTPSPYMTPLKIIPTSTSYTRTHPPPIHSLNVNTCSLPNNFLLVSRIRKRTTTLPPTVSPQPLPPSPKKSSICLPRNGNYADSLTLSTRNTPPQVIESINITSNSNGWKVTTRSTIIPPHS